MTPEDKAIKWWENLCREMNESNPHGPQQGVDTGWNIEKVGLGGTEWCSDPFGLFKNCDDAIRDARCHAVYNLHGCAIRIVHYRKGKPDEVQMASDCRTLRQRWAMRKRNSPSCVPTIDEQRAKMKERLLNRGGHP